MGNKKNTNELISEISKSPSLTHFQQKNKDNLNIPDACEYLLEKAAEKGLKKADLIRLSKIERTYGYHLLSGQRKLTRNKIILFALTAALSLDDTQKILKYAGEPMLYIRNRRDEVLIYALTHKETLHDVDVTLNELNMEPLYNPSID